MNEIYDSKINTIYKRNTWMWHIDDRWVHRMNSKQVQCINNKQMKDRVIMVNEYNV